LKVSKILGLPLALGALLWVGCGDQANESSGLDIINGSTPSDNGLIERSTVALVGSDGQPFCSGTLIAERFVVSAAHCLKNYYNRLYIAFGRDGREFSYVEASDWQIHPSYSGSFYQSVPADISMIALSADAPAGYEPIPVYQGSLRRGDTIYLAGFGQTESGSSGGLLYKGVTVNSADTDEFSVSNGACYGDSGGPAYVFDGASLQVIGATSRGTAGCRGDAVYTNVDYFRSWIGQWSGLNL
jgi:secreted trypsin-like serine protease